MSLITLTVAATIVALPDDLYWADEAAWHPVEQAVSRTLTGAQVIQTAQRVSGRPITLEPPQSDTSAWISRADLEQLLAWAALPGQAMVLSLRGINRTVIWRHQDGEVIGARPVMHWTDVMPDDAYTATLKFMEI